MLSSGIFKESGRRDLGLEAETVLITLRAELLEIASNGNKGLQHLRQQHQAPQRDQLATLGAFLKLIAKKQHRARMETLIQMLILHKSSIYANGKIKIMIMAK